MSYGFVGNDDRTKMMDGGGTTLGRTVSHLRDDNDPNQREHETAEHQWGEQPSQEQRDDDVRALARTMSRRSTRTMGAGDHDDADGEIFNLFEAAEDDPKYDPSKPEFSARAWTSALLAAQQRTHDTHRTAGVAFRNLSAYGHGTAADYQKTYPSILFEAVSYAKRLVGLEKPRRIDILQNLDGLLHAGEMLVVLGPPGSGCSTFLKTITGETYGYKVAKDSEINYQGVSAEHMHTRYRGEATYTAEVDVHFPQLTVWQTLSFAAEARAPRKLPFGISRKVYASHLAKVIMATFGISHTNNTRVGNDFVRGVSGGERKRVTIAEAAVGGAPLSAWDNSTRGLDSANAIEFCKTLKMSTELSNATSAVSIYQAPQAAYDLFDKALVLYEGRQIYFGSSKTARKFWMDRGFYAPERQTDADFLTSLTSPGERRVKEGWQGPVPQTPDEFAQIWRASPEYQALMHEIDDYNKKYPIGGESAQQFKAARRAQQAKGTGAKSPYTLSYVQQVSLCLRRGFWRLRADPSLLITAFVSNAIMALIIASIFFNLPSTTGSFYQRGALIFFAVLLNAFGSALEILTLYAQRPIVEKHSRYAFYHPSAEAWASMITDMPYKIGNTIAFNVVLYFMTGLRREAGAFFFFLLISFMTLLTMSGIFRTIGSLSRSLAQAVAPAAVLILALVIYTGFVIPYPYILGWSKWINRIDPVAYAFEDLMINEFTGRNFECSTYIPSAIGIGAYENIDPINQVCSAVGAVAGQSFVNGDVYIESAYYYAASHRWRNFGILFAFMIFFTTIYLVATEYIQGEKSKGEVLVFRRGHVPPELEEENKAKPNDEESANEKVAGSVPPRKHKTHEEATAATDILERQTAIFQWQDVCYDIKIKKETRRILDHVDGWVKPGTLTALMGVSGAGKTTLLDVLATRVTMGVVTGEMLVDGRQRDESFQRKTGYVQQQDLHLPTSTVREALNFSALLRQPAKTPRKEKLEYVDKVIEMLDMQAYADAVVGVPGTGLNVEQRKRLTIGVELAAKPALLLFLDEPTSGLDSQTSWAILDLLEKLTKSGQAVLCTIHQPSAMLFQRFNRLLFLAKGGKTVYFGEVGENSNKLISYFEKNGAKGCPSDRNPAEWMLEVIGAAPGSHTDIDWPAVWRESPERRDVRDHLADLKETRLRETAGVSDGPRDKSEYKEFAAPLLTQYWLVQKRVFQQYWRSPTYLWSKTGLIVSSSLFIGFSFYKANNTQQGLQNQLFSIFMILTLLGQLTQQIMPLFVQQRELYEARERPSKTFSWKVFMVSQIIAEVPWNTLMAVLLFLEFYYPVGLYRNAEPTNSVNERATLVFLFLWQFLIFAGTFAHLMIAAIPTAETAGNMGNLLFSLSLIFCGVLQPPTDLGWWIWMYRVSPFSYLVSGILSAGVANTDVVCAANELITFEPPAGLTCGEYMDPWIAATGTGYVQDRAATASCEFCSISDTNLFLSQVGIEYSERWRNFGIFWVYIVANVAGAMGLYYLARVPKPKKAEKSKPDEIKASNDSDTAASSSNGAPEKSA